MHPCLHCLTSISLLRAHSSIAGRDATWEARALIHAGLGNVFSEGFDGVFNPGSKVGSCVLGPLGDELQSEVEGFHFGS